MIIKIIDKNILWSKRLFSYSWIWRRNDKWNQKLLMKIKGKQKWFKQRKQKYTNELKKTKSFQTKLNWIFIHLSYLSFY